jgi:hypothetical protein
LVVAPRTAATAAASIDKPAAKNRMAAKRTRSHYSTARRAPACARTAVARCVQLFSVRSRALNASRC